jgi:N-ethylmaleimide reductase
MSSLFEPTRVGDIAVSNRIVMAPLTRNRAAPGQVPSDLAVTYYAQRASAGLIVSEASQVCPEGQGYLDTPGIHSPEQVAGWKKITDAVHAKGGRMVIQLWHVGRISHVSLQPGGQAPVAPSAIQARSKTFLANGFVEVSAPRALRRDEIPGIVDAYRHAARNAMTAGFDGVEVHGANGYLLDQFLRDSTNHRTDDYGGPIENRARLLLEVMHAVTGEIGSGRTGLRLSPVTPANDAGQDSQVQALFDHVIDRLAPLKLAYLHLIEGATGGPRDNVPFDFERLRQRYKAADPAAAWMVNNGYQRQMAIDVVAQGRADLVAFGRPYVGNPDLVRRLKEDAPLTPHKQPLLYGGGAEGYTDYPTLEEITPA